MEILSVEYLGSSKPVNLIEPLVSVCVPTFQHVDYISQCLDSILSQKTDFSFEILIGEDDSTDGTREICVSYANKHPDKIRLFLRKSADKMVRNGKKVGRGNHLALYQSTLGKYVCICDGDDYWLSDTKLQDQVKLMEEFPTAAICVGRTHLDKRVPPLDPTWPLEVKLLKKETLRTVLYKGHVSSWMLRNRMQEFVENEAAIHCPGLDLLVFNYYKMFGDVLVYPVVTSFYRYNAKGSLRKLSPIQVQKKILTMNWFLFRFMHKDPLLFARCIGYFSKRIALNGIKYLIK